MKKKKKNYLYVDKEKSLFVKLTILNLSYVLN